MSKKTQTRLDDVVAPASTIEIVRTAGPATIAPNALPMMPEASHRRCVADELLRLAEVHAKGDKKGAEESIEQLRHLGVAVSLSIAYRLYSLERMRERFNILMEEAQGVDESSFSGGPLTAAMRAIGGELDKAQRRLFAEVGQ